MADYYLLTTKPYLVIRSCPIALDEGQIGFAGFEPVKLVTNQKILVIGSDSVIGQAATEHFRKTGFTVWGTTRHPERKNERNLFLDLGQAQGWRCPVRVEAALVCAGITRFEACEQNPKGTWNINVKGVLEVVEHLRGLGVFVIYLSSHAVFDGSRPFYSPADPVSPISEYGKQKAEVEKRLLSYPNHLAVVRLSKVFHSRMTLLRNWLDSLRQKIPIHPFSDMVIAPVPIALVTRVFQQIIKKRPMGIIHVGGQQDISYAETAYLLANRLGRDRKLVQPITSRQADIWLPLIRHATLEVGRLRSELGLEPPDILFTIDSLFDLPNAMP